MESTALPTEPQPKLPILGRYTPLTFRHSENVIRFGEN